jgi:hypothetical protein
MRARDQLRTSLALRTTGRRTDDGSVHSCFRVEEVGVARCSRVGLVVSREYRRGFYELRHFGALCMPTSLSPMATRTSGGGSTGSEARWAENVGTFRSGWAESGRKAVPKGADLQACPANRTSIAHSRKPCKSRGFRVKGLAQKPAKRPFFPHSSHIASPVPSRRHAAWWGRDGLDGAGV